MKSFLEAQIDGNMNIDGKTYNIKECHNFNADSDSSDNKDTLKNITALVSGAGAILSSGALSAITDALSSLKKDRKGRDQLISEAIAKIEKRPDEASQIAWARTEINEAKKFVTEPDSMKLRTGMERARLEAVVTFLQLYLTLRIAQQQPFNLNNVKTELATFDQFTKQFRADHINTVIDENKDVIDALHRLVETGSGQVSSSLTHGNTTASTSPTGSSATTTSSANLIKARSDEYVSTYGSFWSWLKSLI